MSPIVAEIIMLGLLAMFAGGVVFSVEKTEADTNFNRATWAIDRCNSHPDSMGCAGALPIVGTNGMMCEPLLGVALTCNIKVTPKVKSILEMNA